MQGNLPKITPKGCVIYRILPSRTGVNLYKTNTVIGLSTAVSRVAD